MQLPSAVDSNTYTIICVDRDARSAQLPTNSPLRHMAVSGVSGSVLLTGYSPGLPVNTLAAYSGPQPPAGTGCHRYYIMVYQQAPGSVPVLPASNRTLWNMTAFAAMNNLSVVAVGYWSTQSNTTFGQASCATPSSGSPAPHAGWASAALVLAGAVFTLRVGT